MQYCNAPETEPNTPRQSFATALKHPQNTPVTSIFPNKDQAIVLSAVEGIKLQEYLTAIATVTNPKNITFASKISNNRICIYFANKTNGR